MTEIRLNPYIRDDLLLLSFLNYVSHPMILDYGIARNWQGANAQQLAIPQGTLEIFLGGHTDFGGLLRCVGLGGGVPSAGA